MNPSQVTVCLKDCIMIKKKKDCIMMSKKSFLYFKTRKDSLECGQLGLKGAESTETPRLTPGFRGGGAQVGGNRNPRYTGNLTATFATSLRWQAWEVSPDFSPLTVAWEGRSMIPVHVRRLGSVRGILLAWECPAWKGLQSWVRDSPAVANMT